MSHASFSSHCSLIMKRIGIFGGSFNPVHLGHTALAAAICEQGLVDEVWLVVSPQNPLKRNADLLDEEVRLTMVRLAVADYPMLQACDFEFRLPRPSYTYHTLQALREAYPDCEFSLIVGEDNWESFGRWYRSDEILRMTPIIVYPRSGSVTMVTPVDCRLSIVNSPLLPYSSTEIRTLIASGQDVCHMLHPDVAQYIHQYNLYR